MQHQKLEKRGSWNGFESTTHATPEAKHTALALSADLQRCQSTQEECSRAVDGIVPNLPQGITQPQSIWTNPERPVTAEVHVAQGGAVEASSRTKLFSHHKIHDRGPAHLQADNCCKTFQVDNETRNGSEASRGSVSEQQGVVVSSLRLHAMEAQLSELHQQLQTIKTAHDIQAPVSSPPCDPTRSSTQSEARDQVVCLENMTRQLNIAKSEKNEMRAKIGELERDLALCNHKSKREILGKERLQAELRRLADMIASSHPDDRIRDDDEGHATPERGASPEALTEGDVNALKEQLRIFEEDFTNERSDGERLRVQNIRLMQELEEAKRVIEDQQRQLLLYAHLSANDGTSSVVLSPMNDSLDRRSRSVPSTPNSSPLNTNLVSRYIYNGKEATYIQEGSRLKNSECLRHFPPDMRPLSDVVPRGHHRNRQEYNKSFPMSFSMPGGFSESDEVFPPSSRSSNSPS